MELCIKYSTFVTSPKHQQRGYQRKLCQNLKQSNGKRMPFLHRMVFHSNCLRRFGLAHTDCKEMDLCPISAFSPAFFDKPTPKLNLLYLASATSTQQAVILHMGPLFLKNCSDRACRVVYLSPCCMFHASLCTIQSKKVCTNFHFLVVCYLLQVDMTSLCLQVSSLFLRLYVLVTA